MSFPPRTRGCLEIPAVMNTSRIYKWTDLAGCSRAMPIEWTLQTTTPLAQWFEGYPASRVGVGGQGSATHKGAVGCIFFHKVAQPARPNKYRKQKKGSVTRGTYISGFRRRVWPAPWPPWRPWFRAPWTPAAAGGAPASYRPSENKLGAGHVITSLRVKVRSAMIWQQSVRAMITCLFLSLLVNSLSARSLVQLELTRPKPK